MAIVYPLNTTSIIDNMTTLIRKAFSCFLGGFVIRTEHYSVNDQIGLKQSFTKNTVLMLLKLHPQFRLKYTDKFIAHCFHFLEINCKKIHVLI